VNGQAKNQSGSRVERVLLLKAKNAGGVLKGREASREFEACPVIGSGTTDSYSGD
jgi:hypothetical protein